MSKVYIPARNPEAWKNLLADSIHWKPGHSAWALAHSWQKAEGFPATVERVFRNSGLELFRNVELLFAFPEHKVDLPARGEPSHSDLLAVARGNGQLVVMAVEGKVKEPFGNKTVGEWLGKSPSDNRFKRLTYLLNRLALREDEVQNIRYQLLHRTVSALIEADRLCAANALMLVHSFSEKNAWFDEYADFLSLFELPAVPDLVVGPAAVNDTDLYFGWVRGDRKFLRK